MRNTIMTRLLQQRIDSRIDTLLHEELNEEQFGGTWLRRRDLLTLAMKGVVKVLSTNY